MRRSKWILALAAACALLVPTLGAGAASGGQVADLAAFKAALADVSVSEIVLVGKISGNETLEISGRSNLIIRGEDAVLSGLSFAVTDSSVVSFRELVIENAPASAIAVTDSQTVSVTECTVTGSKNYALEIRTTGNTRSTVTATNLVTSGNAKGGALLSGGSFLQIAGAVGTADDVLNPELAEQIRTGENDRNVGPNGEVVVAALYEKDGGVVNFPADADYMRREVTLGDRAAVAVIRPYDVEAPVFRLLETGTLSAAVGGTISLEHLAVSDNRTAAADIKIRLSVKGPDGKAVALTGQSERFPDGVRFAAEAAGEYEVQCVAEDAYGNVSKPRYLYAQAGAAELPVISNPHFAGLRQCGETVQLPAYTARDAEGEAMAVTVRVFAPDGSEVKLSENRFVPAASGIYRIEIRAGEGRAQALRTQTIQVVEAGSHAEPQPFRWQILVGVLAGVLIVGLVALELLWPKLRKRKHS